MYPPPPHMTRAQSRSCTIGRSSSLRRRVTFLSPRFIHRTHFVFFFLLSITQVHTQNTLLHPGSYTKHISYIYINTCITCTHTHTHDTHSHTHDRHDDTYTHTQTHDKHDDTCTHMHTHNSNSPSICPRPQVTSGT